MEGREDLTNPPPPSLRTESRPKPKSTPHTHGRRAVELDEGRKEGEVQTARHVNAGEAQGDRKPWAPSSVPSPRRENLEEVSENGGQAEVGLLSFPSPYKPLSASEILQLIRNWAAS